MLSIRPFNSMRLFGSNRASVRLPKRRATEGNEPPRDFMRDAVNLLATFRFFSVVIVVTLTAVLESRETQQTSLVVLATIAAVLSLVIVAIGRTLVMYPIALHVLDVEGRKSRWWLQDHRSQELWLALSGVGFPWWACDGLE